MLLIRDFEAKIVHRKSWSVPWTTYIRLKRTQWAFWSGGKGFFFNQISLLLLPSAAPFCSFLLLLCSRLLFFLAPISLPGPTQEECSPFVPTSTKCSVVGLAGIQAEQQHGYPEAAGSCNPVLQLDSAAAKHFNSAESSMRQRQGWQSAGLCSIGWLWRELEVIFFLFFLFS